MRINFVDGAIPFAMGNVPCVVVGTSPMEGGIRQCCVGVTRLAEDGECTVEVVHDPHPEADGFVEGELSFRPTYKFDPVEPVMPVVRHQVI